MKFAVGTSRWDGDHGIHMTQDEQLRASLDWCIFVGGFSSASAGLLKLAKDMMRPGAVPSNVTSVIVVWPPPLEHLPAQHVPYSEILPVLRVPEWEQLRERLESVRILPA